MAAETTAREFLFASLIFGAVIAGAFTLIAIALPQTDTGNFSAYNDTYNKFTNLRTDAEASTAVVKDAAPVNGPLGILNGLIEASWGSLTLVWNSFTTLTSVIDDTSTGGLRVFNLPIWFTGLIITMILVTITFAIMAAWFQWRI